MSARPVWQLCLAHAVPGSFIGLAPGPRLCNQHNQPTKPSWVGTHTNSKDPCPSIMDIGFFPDLFTWYETYVLTTEGQVLNQMQRWRETGPRDVEKQKGRVGWEGSIWENGELNIGGL